MATLDKNFRIKNGLVVEGSTATVNGNNILTENASDQYILNLIGGETLVKSVSSDFNVDGSGQLTISTSSDLARAGDITNALSTAQGYADTAEQNAKDYSDSLASNYDAAGSAASAYSDATSYTDSEIASEVTARNTAITNAISTEVSNRNSAISTAKSEAINAAAQDATTKANSAEQNAKSYADSLASNYDAAGAATTAYNNAVSTASSDATTKANAAEQNAKDYADSLASNYDAAGAANNAYNNALADANTYTDGKVSDLVNSAPQMLDTLGELATALQNNPDIISNLQDVAAGKQDTLTAGEGIYIDGDSVITGRQQAGGGLKFVYNEAAIDRSTVDGWYDAAGSAQTAQQNAEFNAGQYTDQEINSALNTAQGYANTAENNAKSYADNLASNYDAAGSATTAENNAKSYADSLASNYDAAGSAAQALTDANSYTDTAVGNIAGAVSQIDGAVITPNAVTINSVANQYATSTIGINVSDGVTSVFGVSSSTYRTLKALVKAKNGNHTQVSEILVTLDTSNNVAITEYAMVGTNGSLGDVSAIHHASGNIFVTFTPVYNNTDVMVYATALI